MDTPDKYLKPHQARQRYAVRFGFTLFVYITLAFLFGNGRVTGFLGLAALAFFFVWFGFRTERDARKVAEMAAADVMHAGERVVDPWELQMRVMHASGQRTPGHPRLHQGVLLYGALMMEELGETLSELGSILLTTAHASSAGSRTLPLQVQRMYSLATMYTGHGLSLAEDAAMMRLSVAEVPDLDLPMNWDQAVSLFDGTTDVAVVNCGFALSCGFPGSAGYREVQLSNMSKVNPATGVIDKTPDGKWIKGVNYWGPDLVTVLREQKFSLHA